ncbi:MFS transporter [Deinococcus navajonensis]|uniref:MFS transporter n=1 Tax=Deinococcus navajonensis TaxID=309884 RepID=A0ABV8XLW6_9DEIO
MSGPEQRGRRAPALVFAALGTLVFLNVYAPQSLLSLLARDFGVGPAAVGGVVGATMLAMALASPLTGVVADAWGRRRTVLWAFGLLVLPALLASAAPSLAALNAARFAQGLLIPGVMVALNAYIAEDVTPDRRPGALSAYVTGTVLGGFLGRFLSGLVASRGDWHAAFWLLALACALGWIVARTALPPETAFQPRRNPRVVLAGLHTHLHNPALRATCAVGFLILFTLVGTFNTLTLRLAGAPYGLSTVQSGAVFAVYLLGVVITPVAGPFLAARGPRTALLVAVGASVLGLLVTLTTPLPLVIAGVAATACGVFLAQAAALAAVQRSVSGARSLAGGLYHLSYYGGAALSSVVAGQVFETGGWPATVPLLVGSLLLAALAGTWGWRRVRVKPT